MAGTAHTPTRKRWVWWAGAVPLLVAEILAYVGSSNSCHCKGCDEQSRATILLHNCPRFLVPWLTGALLAAILDH